MMSSQDQQTYDDRFLIQYLLGALPRDEADRLDELCVADDELATRLIAVENDLVDAYVRGELPGEDHKHFQSFYLSSAKRREKVEFATALLEFEKKPIAVPAAESQPAQEVVVPAVTPRVKREGKPAVARKSSASRLTQWGFAFATAMLLCLGYLLVENLRLQRQMDEAQVQHSAADQRERQLQKQLNSERSANAESLKEIERLRQWQASPEEPKTVSLLLRPPTRGVAKLPTVSIPPETNLAILLLELESNEFPSYRASLEDPATGQILWSSGSLQVSSLGRKKVLTVSFPAHFLKQQNYLIALTGQPARGAPESIAHYPFRAVLK
jgi:anti-sigma factor RsiW